jgi:ascorbate-specific PTS system EIIC-type component UlaA
MTTSTVTTELTDRYVWAVVRHLHAEQRGEVEAELRSTIADMAEATDERCALEQLGDPEQLAANYRGGHRVLIGPAVYPDYVRLLRLLMWIVVPLLAVLAAFGAVLGDDVTVGGVVTAVLGAALTGAVQVSFWVTVVFVLIDRYASEEIDRERRPWTLHDLPELPAARQVGLGEVVGECAGTLLLVVALFAQRVWSPVRTADGEPVPLIAPDLWDSTMWLVVALLLVTAALVVAAYLRGGWSWPLAAATAVADLVLFGLIAVAAMRDQLINPEFLVELSADLDLDAVWQPNAAVIVLVVGVVLAWDAAEALRKAARRAALD